MAAEPARLAIDLGGSKIAAALLRGSAILDRRQINTPRESVSGALVPAIIGLVSDLLPRSSGPIAVATTGFATKGRVSAINPVTMPFPDQFDLGGGLAAATGRKLTVVNDAQAAAFGEYVAGAGQGLDSFAFLTVSTGVGGGLVAGGRLLEGPTGFAGHLGHVVVRPDGPPCGCGRHGCAEAIASGTAIADFATRALSAPCDAAEAIRRAEGGDPIMAGIVDTAAQAIATLAANLKAALDIEALVMGGGVGLNPAFRRRVEAAMGREPVRFRTPLRVALCGADAGLIGAATLADSARPEPS